MNHEYRGIAIAIANVSESEPDDELLVRLKLAVPRPTYIHHTFIVSYIHVDAINGVT
jgi:hypothetical protein